jgi:hypothetical protein
MLLATLDRLPPQEVVTTSNSPGTGKSNDQVSEQRLIHPKSTMKSLAEAVPSGNSSFAASHHQRHPPEEPPPIDVQVSPFAGVSTQIPSLLPTQGAVSASKHQQQSAKEIPSLSPTRSAVSASKHQQQSATQIRSSSPMRSAVSASKHQQQSATQIRSSSPTRRVVSASKNQQQSATQIRSSSPMRSAVSASKHQQQSAAISSLFQEAAAEVESLKQRIRAIETLVQCAFTIEPRAANDTQFS